MISGVVFFSFFLFLIEIPVVYENSVDPDQRSGSAQFAYVPNWDARHERVKGLGTAECFVLMVSQYPQALPPIPQKLARGFKFRI